MTCDLARSVRALRVVRLGLLIAAVLPSLLNAQAVDSTHVISRTIGLPPRLRLALEPAFEHGPAAGANLYKAVLNPSVGVLGVQAEAYFGRISGRNTGDVALGLRSPILALGGGADLDVSSHHVSPFISFTHPIRRGGFIIRGASLHATWLFSGATHLRAGISIPVLQPWVGKDRPLHDRVHLATPRAPRISAVDDSLARAVSDLRAWLLRASEAVVPGLDSLSAIAQPPDVLAQYHASLDHALQMAGAPTDSVRRILLDSLLLPFDRLLGQKREPETLAPFAAATLDGLARYGARAAWVVQQMVAALDDVVATQRQRWGDARLVWLPLQLALRSDEVQTQAQLDSLIERATLHVFSDSNEVVYVPNEQFQWQLYRSIHEARTYHVLWVHDFVGYNDDGKPDADSYRQVTYGYLSALLERVRKYDTEGILPDFQIFFDEYYYDIYGSRLWMAVLQDPLHAHARLRGRPVEWQTKLDSLQSALRDAVAHSQRLQAEARRHGGDAWLRKRVAVHVHITQQPDPSFFSSDILPLIGMSDNAAHDHRKIAFYDITDTDPYRGALIVAGVGVGEVYAGTAWEDRAAILRGTAAQAVKREAERLLTGNGIDAADLPFWLKASHDTVPPSLRAPKPHFYDDGGVTAINIHNEVGYGAKPITVTKALVYSLMPPGSVIKIANPLILNPLWGSLLLGSVMRGGRVVLMAPSMKNTVFLKPENSLQEELLARLLVVRNRLAPAIDRAGGMLRVGIYNIDTPVDDISARIDTLLANRARTPWMRELEPFAPEVIDSLRAVAAQLRGSAPSDTASTHDAPKLHIKEDFAASREAWENLFVQPGWGAALAAYYRAAAQAGRTAARFAEFDTIDVNTQLGTGASLLLRQEIASQQSERAIYYIISGSFNADYRSALLDGESMLVISHFGAAAGIGDFVLLPGLCTWVDTPDELHRYLPRRTGFAKTLSHALRILF